MFKKKVPDYAGLKSFAEDLKLLPVSARTQEAYFACVCQWAEYFKTAPDLITAEQLRQYFIHLKCIKKVARQTSTQALCAIKLFWEKSLRRVWPAELELVRAQPRFKLPVILSAQEVRLIFSCAPALDQRAHALIKLRKRGSSRAPDCSAHGWPIPVLPG